MNDAILITDSPPVASTNLRQALNKKKIIPAKIVIYVRARICRNLLAREIFSVGISLINVIKMWNRKSR